MFSAGLFINSNMPSLELLRHRTTMSLMAKPVSILTSVLQIRKNHAAARFIFLINELSINFRSSSLQYTWSIYYQYTCTERVSSSLKKDGNGFTTKLDI